MQPKTLRLRCVRNLNRNLAAILVQPAQFATGINRINGVLQQFTQCPNRLLAIELFATETLNQCLHIANFDARIHRLPAIRWHGARKVFRTMRRAL